MINQFDIMDVNIQKRKEKERLINILRSTNWYSKEHSEAYYKLEKILGNYMTSMLYKRIFGRVYPYYGHKFK